MGVPAFFRWLSRKFSSIVVDAVEEKPRELNGERIPVDIRQPNPNGVEFDCLYLDMNGIIHPCCHPEDRPAPKNEDEMMVAIFEYIDRLMMIIRPRKLLYMAIDGVAPRAKMNQQRSRRFRSAKDTAEKDAKIREIKAELAARGIILPPEKQHSDHFDSNCITPGTPFMSRLADCLRFYIYEKQNADPAWQTIEVILSDASVPGEGEHKIMDFIRRQRAQPHYNPNLHHVLCGADADLIMLGLATHEPHFTIIREEFRPDRPKTCEICSQVGHTMTECQGLAREKQGENDEFGGAQTLMETQFIFLRLNVVREYLERELWIENLSFSWSLERLIDDWVFMCFFVGNDFLPHMPSLEIREGAIDRLVRLYKAILPKAGGYLTHDGYVDLDRTQLLLDALGREEDQIFRGRRDEELNRRKRVINQRRGKRRRTGQWDEQYVPQNAASTVNLAPLGRGNGGGSSSFSSPSVSNITRDPRANDNKSAAAQLKWQLLGPSGQLASSNSPPKSNSPPGTKVLEPTPPFYAPGTAYAGMKRRLPTSSPSNSSIEDSSGGSGQEDNDLEVEFAQDDARDEIKLWEDGWRERYYQTKFTVEANVREFGHKVALEYVRGLAWVLLYYYQGCPSWKWYYPYHYAPFASDMTCIKEANIAFNEPTTPFRPLEQLMAVFPAASRKFLPVTWQQLMFDPESPIIDQYPTDFEIDLNGKKFAWQGVALLPFVDEERLLSTLRPLYADLTPEEQQRNSYGYDAFFVHKAHKLYDYLVDLYAAERQPDAPAPLDPKLSNGGFQGLVWCDERCILENETVPSPFDRDMIKRPIACNQVVCVKYKDPQYAKGFVFQARLIQGVQMPRRVVKPSDWDDRTQGRWQVQIGFNGQGRDGYQGGNPDAANRFIRNSLGGNDNRGYNNNYNNNYGRGGGWNNNRGGYRGGNYNNNYHGGGGYGAPSYTNPNHYDPTRPNFSAPPPSLSQMPPPVFLRPGQHSQQVPPMPQGGYPMPPGNHYNNNRGHHNNNYNNNNRRSQQYD